MMIVIKIGGSVVDGLHNSTINDIQRTCADNQVVIVHGGGKDVTEIATKLGKEQKFVVSPGGVRSRYTDKETVNIYTMVMAGKINKLIVGELVKHGIKAVGISGVDGNILNAERKKKLLVINDKGRKMIIDGGYTGKIKNVDPTLIHLLMDSNYVPVISPIALSEQYDFLNVDGDRAAAYIAGSLHANRVIFLTNVDGLIIDDNIVHQLSLQEAKSILPKIGFGMEKKVLACTEAIDMGVKEAIISSGKKENPVTSAIAHKNCTVII